MNTKLARILFLFLVATLVVGTFTVVAQTVTNTVPAVGAPGVVFSKANLWAMATAIVTPLVVSGIKKLVPKIPKVMLPIATPFVGIALGLLLNWVGSLNLSWMDMAQAGAMAVFVREVFDQAVKSRTPPAPASEPPA